MGLKEESRVKKKKKKKEDQVAQDRTDQDEVKVKQDGDGTIGNLSILYNTTRQLVVS